MPLFEYRCESCEKEFEILVRGNEQATCPDCQSDKVEKLISVAVGKVAGGSQSLPITSPSCPPPDAPPCGPGCCKIR